MIPPFAALPMWFKPYNHNTAWWVFMWSHIFCSGYSYVWDIYMDWGLCRHFENDKKKYLRKKMMYKPIFYWYAAVSDLILRFVWIFGLYRYGQADSWYNRAQGTSLILITLEAFRRSQWALLRVENEQCNNFEQYRTIPIIPPIIETDEKDAKQ